jgi:RNA polymerase sigma-70 factor (ECF subfamily)
MPAGPKANGAAAALPIPAALVRELYAQSGASRFSISESDFAEMLGRVAAKNLDVASLRHASEEKVTTLYRSLKIEDLALAHGCARGDEKAWEVFLTRFRVKLYDAARSITREDSAGRELADSIYADLYGMTEREGERVSKLSFYTGRGSLEGWLRTVMAQEWVNRYRKKKHEVSLEEETEEKGAQFAAPVSDGAAEVQSPVVAATDSALAALSSEDRYILASYYVDERTLAEIAKTLKVHESTISRKLEKLAVAIRKNILDTLVRGGMSKRQAEEAMEIDVRDLNIDLRNRLQQPPAREGLPGAKKSAGNVQESGK